MFYVLKANDLILYWKTHAGPKRRKKKGFVRVLLDPDAV